MSDKYQAVADALGEQRAKRLIACVFGTADALYFYLISTGSIEPDV